MTFPPRYERTRRFRLGVPDRFTVSPDGTRVVFCRTRGGTDPVSCLWVYHVAGGDERLLVDPSALGDADAPVPDEERIRRERAREQSTGITAYATDTAMRVAVFSLSGKLWRVDLESGAVAEVAARPGHRPAAQPGRHRDRIRVPRRTAGCRGGRRPGIGRTGGAACQ